MLNSPDSEQISIAKMGELGESASIYKISGQAFDQIHRYRTPPDPVTYSVWYAYASKSPAIVTTKINKLISKCGYLSPDDLSEIYQAHISDNSPEAANLYIGREFESNLSVVTELLLKGMQKNAGFKATLDDVEKSIPETLSANALQGIVTKLLDESQRMAQASKDITEGLEESQKQVEQLNIELERVRNQSLCDPLTEIANRRAFDNRIASEIEHSENAGSSFCLIIADIDQFKFVNDSYGHQAGDAVLKMFASIIIENIKGHDLVARIGGDEFAIILPNTEIISAYNLMVTIKTKFGNAEFETGDQRQSIGSVSASFGISSYKPQRSAKDMIEQADSNLYQAKASGRNCVKAEGLG